MVESKAYSIVHYRKIRVKTLFSSRLPMMRKAVGISQYRLAKVLGTTRNNYVSWEYGKICPDPLTLKIIVSDIFGVPLETFLNLKITTKKIVEKIYEQKLEIAVRLSKGIVPTPSNGLAVGRNNRSRMCLLFQERIPKIRTYQGVTQMQMAKLLGVSRNVYTSWELGRYCIDPISLRILTNDIIGITLETFFDENISTEDIISKYVKKVQNQPASHKIEE